MIRFLIASLTETIDGGSWNCAGDALLPNIRMKVAKTVKKNINIPVHPR